MHLWNGESVGSIYVYTDCSIFVHFPFGFLHSTRPPFIKHHCLLQSNYFVIRRVDICRRTGGFPVAIGGGPAWPSSLCFPFLSRHKKEPLLSVPTTKLTSQPYMYIETHNELAKQNAMIYIKPPVKCKVMYTYLEGCKDCIRRHGRLG